MAHRTNTSRCDIKDELEKQIDRSDLRTVVELLLEICYDKAEHLRANWQDEVSAKTWEKDAKMLDKIAGKLEN
jgi:hypothetical protein